MPRRSDYDTRQEAAMSQQLADIDNDYIELAGSDPKISKKIMRLKNFRKLGWISKEEADLMLLFLNGDRKAAFATNEKSSDVTKLGLQIPKSQKGYGLDDDEEENT